MLIIICSNATMMPIKQVISNPCHRYKIHDDLYLPMKLHRVRYISHCVHQMTAKLITFSILCSSNRDNNGKSCTNSKITQTIMHHGKTAHTCVKWTAEQTNYVTKHLISVMGHLLKLLPFSLHVFCVITMRWKC